MRDWGAETGCENAAREAAEALTRARPAEANSWLILADMITDPGEFPAQLAALDRAIAARPRALLAYDTKARLLAVAGRYDEAFAVCESHPAPVKAPLLLAREGWILWLKHDLKAAITRMQEAVEADPGLVWGWELLVEWHQEDKNLDAAEKAAVKVSQLQPDEPVHFGRLFEIREKQGDEAGCVTALERALQVAPNYSFALSKLMAHHAAKGRHDEARRLLDESRPHHASVEYWSRLFIWHWRQKQHSEARKALLKMMAEPAGSDDSCNRVFEELKQKVSSKEARKLEKFVAAAIQEGCTHNSHAGLLYVNLVQHFDRVPQWQVIQNVPVDDAGGEQMMVRYIEGIGERWSQMQEHNFGGLRSSGERRRLSRLIRLRRTALRSNDDLWGTVGYALHSMKRWPDTVNWLSDWRDRPDAEPYMLNNLFFSLQNLGREAESREVGRRGMEFPRHNEMTMRFHIYAALDDLLECRTESAQKHLAVVHEDDLGGYSKRVLRVAQEMLHYQPGSKIRAFGAGPSDALEAFLEVNEENRTATKLAWRACSLAARQTRSILPKLWFVQQRYAKSVGMAIFFILVLAFKWMRR